jgi:two-component system KDP operon response regulator KdpE
VIDDEPQLQRLLRLVLEEAGYVVLVAATGEAGLAEAAYKRPDLIVLDLGLPDLGGTEVLKRLREWASTPVLVLSVRSDSRDKVAALDAGADDFVTKPFEGYELLARLRALQRRTHTGAEAPSHVFAGLTLDLAGRQVLVKGKEVRLTPIEYGLLRILGINAGKVVTQKTLLQEVWGGKAGEQSHYLRVHFAHLRRKLRAAGWDADRIRTEPGIGYRLLAE